MKAFLRSCDHADNYPTNFLSVEILPPVIASLKDQLERRSERLFCGETRSSLDFLEQSLPGKPFEHRCITSLSSLENHLRSFDPDPHCRFM